MVAGTGIHQGQTYSIQVLLPRFLELHAVSLLLALRRWRGDIVLATHSPEHVTLAIATGDLPLYVQLFHTHPEEFANELIEALAWSPAWHERWEDTARRCPASVVIAMTAQRPINYASMLLSFLSVLDTWLHTLDIDDRERAVLHWMPAKQLLTYHQYQLLRTELGPCGPAVNVRIANATGRPGELLEARFAQCVDDPRARHAPTLPQRRRRRVVPERQRVAFRCRERCFFDPRAVQAIADEHAAHVRAQSPHDRDRIAIGEHDL